LNRLESRSVRGKAVTAHTACTQRINMQPGCTLLILHDVISCLQFAPCSSEPKGAVTQEVAAAVARQVHLPRPNEVLAGDEEQLHV
jgi:hypothetical protein